MVRFSLLVKPDLIPILIPAFVLMFLVDLIFFPGSARTENGRDVAILTAAFPDFSITADNPVTVYGTAQPNQIAIASRADAELLHFPGTNTLSVTSTP